MDWKIDQRIFASAHAVSHSRDVSHSWCNFFYCTLVKLRLNSVFLVESGIIPANLKYLASLHGQTGE